MGSKKGFRFDHIAVFCSLAYVLFPLVIFAFGWLRMYWAVPITVATGFLFCHLFRVLTAKEVHLVTRSSAVYWVSLVFVAFVWVYFSGIGGFTFQNLDFWERNIVYYDLCNKPWPVFYDLPKQVQEVQVLGSGEVALSYYFGFWLIPAMFAKLFSFARHSQDLLLYLYAVLGILLIFYQITRIMRKPSFVIPVVFIFFSGLDFVGYTVINRTLPHSLSEQLEWWAELSQYSSNTTLLYWVFNQAIPLWIILSLFLQLDEKDIPAIACFSFLYSPWATVGLVPLCLYAVFKNGLTSFKRALTWQNFTFAGILLFTLGSLYMAASATSLFLSPIEVGGILNYCMRYACFVFLEAGVFLLVMGKACTRWPYYFVAVGELLLCPLLHFVEFDFDMRGSIPALFILCLYCIRFLMAADRSLSRRKVLLAIVLCIGALTPVTEINRSLKYTAAGVTVNLSAGTSFDNISAYQKDFGAFANRLFVYNYEQTFFFRYFAK